jgi:hypothetical protein
VVGVLIRPLQLRGLGVRSWSGLAFCPIPVNWRGLGKRQDLTQSWKLSLVIRFAIRSVARAVHVGSDYRSLLLGIVRKRVKTYFAKAKGCLVAIEAKDNRDPNPHMQKARYRPTPDQVLRRLLWAVDLFVFFRPLSARPRRPRRFNVRVFDTLPFRTRAILSAKTLI